VPKRGSALNEFVPVRNLGDIPPIKFKRVLPQSPLRTDVKVTVAKGHFCVHPICSNAETETETATGTNTEAETETETALDRADPPPAAPGLRADPAAT
jgi:hypothetical protein